MNDLIHFHGKSTASVKAVSTIRFEFKASFESLAKIPIKLWSFSNRTSQASMVHALIDSYTLTKSMDVVTAMPATEDELRLFHSAYYLNYLKENCNDESRIQNTDATAGDDSDESDDSNVDDERLEYGLGKCTSTHSSFQAQFSISLHHICQDTIVQNLPICGSSCVTLAAVRQRRPSNC